MELSPPTERSMCTSSRPPPVSLERVQEVLERSRPTHGVHRTSSESFVDFNLADTCHSIKPEEDLARSRAAFLEEFGPNIVVRDRAAIAPWSALVSVRKRRVHEGITPVYVEAPARLPMRQTPWVVNVCPPATIDLGAIVELPVIGLATVHSMVAGSDAGGRCVFRLITALDGSEGARIDSADEIRGRAAIMSFL